MTSIHPNDILAINTKVQVNGKRGYVVKADIEKDQFGMPITVHTIQFTEKYSHRHGNKPIYKPYTKRQQVNYASIYVVE